MGSQREATVYGDGGTLFHFRNNRTKLAHGINRSANDRPANNYSRNNSDGPYKIRLFIERNFRALVRMVEGIFQKLDLIVARSDLYRAHGVLVFDLYVASFGGVFDLEFFCVEAMVEPDSELDSEKGR